MNSVLRADIVPFIKHATLALRPIAQAEDIDLTFSSRVVRLVAWFQPALVISDFTSILAKATAYVPEQERVSVSVIPMGSHKCSVRIEITGINLSNIGAITDGCRLPVTVQSAKGKTTRYTLDIEWVDQAASPPIEKETALSSNYVPDQYAELRNRLRAHFNNSETLMEVLSKRQPNEASFLERVNEAIVQNLSNSRFDANALSDTLNMSRTQLYRRLLPIIQQSPGRYIRSIKLQKAKELFETTELRISEVAYRTGFETASHFTKVFTRQYGVKPSIFRKRKFD